MFERFGRDSAARRPGVSALAGRTGKPDINCRSASLFWHHVTPTVPRNHLRMVRNLRLYRRRTEPTCFVPDLFLSPPAPTPAPLHLYVEGNCPVLLSATSTLSPTPQCSLRPQVFRQAVALLSIASISASISTVWWMRSGGRPGAGCRGGKRPSASAPFPLADEPGESCSGRSARGCRRSCV